MKTQVMTQRNRPERPITRRVSVRREVATCLEIRNTGAGAAGNCMSTQRRR